MSISPGRFGEPAVSAEAPARAPRDDAGKESNPTAEVSGLVRAAGLVQAEIIQAALEQAELEQAKAMVALIFAITPPEAMGLLSLAVDQRGWSLAKVAHTVLDLSRQPRGGDLDLVRHRFTLLLFSLMSVEALVARANAHGLEEGPGAAGP